MWTRTRNGNGGRGPMTPMTLFLIVLAFAVILVLFGVLR